MSERIILLRLFGVSILWGFNYVAGAYLLRDFSPIFLSYSRLFLISIFLVSVACISKKIKRPTRRELLLLLFAGIFGTLLNQTFYFTGLQGSTAGNAALIIALSPIATILLARIFLGESITLFKLLGAVMALVGICFIVLFGGASIGISKGNVYLLLAMFSLSVSLLFIRKLSVTMSSYDITILGTVIGTLLMTPAAVVEAVKGLTQTSTHIWMWIILVCTAIFGQGLAAFWWNQGISAVGASTSSMFMNISPFVAIVLSFLLLGDSIQIAQIAGGTLILSGVALANRKLKTPVTTAA